MEPIRHASRMSVAAQVTIFLFYGYSHTCGGCNAGVNRIHSCHGKTIVACCRCRSTSAARAGVRTTPTTASERTCSYEDPKQHQHCDPAPVASGDSDQEQPSQHRSTAQTKQLDRIRRNACRSRSCRSLHCQHSGYSSACRDVHTCWIKVACWQTLCT